MMINTVTFGGITLYKTGATSTPAKYAIGIYSANTQQSNLLPPKGQLEIRDNDFDKTVLETVAQRNPKIYELERYMQRPGVKQTGPVIQKLRAILADKLDPANPLHQPYLALMDTKVTPTLRVDNNLQHQNDGCRVYLFDNLSVEQRDATLTTDD